jgi:hypothetical protein
LKRLNLATGGSAWLPCCEETRRFRLKEKRKIGVEKMHRHRWRENTLAQRELVVQLATEGWPFHDSTASGGAFLC